MHALTWCGKSGMHPATDIAWVKVLLPSKSEMGDDMRNALCLTFVCLIFSSHVFAQETVLADGKLPADNGLTKIQLRDVCLESFIAPNGKPVVLLAQLFSAIAASKKDSGETEEQEVFYANLTQVNFPQNEWHTFYTIPARWRGEGTLDEALGSVIGLFVKEIVKREKLDVTKIDKVIYYAAGSAGGIPVTVVRFFDKDKKLLAKSGRFSACREQDLPEAPTLK